MQRNLVGARELKARLGTYLQKVRRGRTVVVTDRGVPVAEIRPLGAGDGPEAALAALRATGAVSWSGERGLARFRPIAGRGASVSSAVSEDRVDRF